MGTFEPVTEQESKWINLFIVDLERRAASSGDTFDIWDTGKVIRYIGWFWRQVDFTQPFTLGRCTDPGHDPFIGFMENNKWGYDEWTVTPEQYESVVKALRALRDMPEITVAAIKVFDRLIQDCGPEAIAKTGGAA